MARLAPPFVAAEDAAFAVAVAAFVASTVAGTCADADNVKSEAAIGFNGTCSASFANSLLRNGTGAIA